MNSLVDGKVCKRCGAWKLLSDYHKDRTRPDGYYDRCKACKRAADLARPRATVASKVCCGCGDEKPAGAFYKNGRSPDGLQRLCIACRKAYHRDYYQRRAEHVKGKARRWKQANPERKRALDKSYREQHGECIRQYLRRWHSANSERLKPIKRADYRNNLARYRQYFHDRYWADPERARARARQDYRNHRESRLAACQQHYLLHRDQRLARAAVWKRNNRDRVQALHHRRRARKLAAEGSYTATEWQALCAWFGNRCLACGTEGPLTVDHVIALARGGSNFIGNLQPLCGPCNSRKNARHADYRDPELLASFLASLRE